VAALLGVAVTSCDQTRFTLRTPPGPQVDVFRQATVPVVDVLWVVDNSTSMVQEQQGLADNFSSFFKYLTGTGADYHIGVISTDVYDADQHGKLQGAVPIISQATPDAAEVYATNVQVGIGGKGDEQGFKAADLSLSEPLLSTDNAGFLREGGYLFMIFVSDEDDHSFGEPLYYLRKFKQIKGIGNDGMVNIAAVVGDVPGGCATAKSGTRYTELAQASSGISPSVCSAFADSLDQLGFAAAGLKRNFSLSHTAVPASLTVYIKGSCAREPMPAVACQKSFDDCAGSGEDVYGHTCVVKQSLPDGFAFEADSNSIHFFGQSLPPFGSIIEVGYTPEEQGP
jgi:hypothetical protein